MRLALLLVLAVGCGKDKADAPPAPGERAGATAGSAAASSTTEGTATISEESRARAATLVGELKKSLLGAVTAALNEGAPKAIEACHAMAPALTAAVAREGAVVGRATRKPRNPANAASGWQADALSHFEQLVASGTPLAGATFTRMLDGGRAAYAEPLVIAEVCTTCHGTQVADDVKAVLAEKYPADQATGYVVGDLRGVAWVELPAK